MRQIGPKVQANVPESHYEFIETEARERGTYSANIIRELIEIGVKYHNRWVNNCNHCSVRSGGEVE